MPRALSSHIHIVFLIALGACIAAGGTLHLVRRNRQDRQQARDEFQEIRDDRGQVREELQALRDGGSQLRDELAQLRATSGEQPGRPLAHLSKPHRSGH